MAFLISIIKPIAYLSVPLILLRTLTHSSSTCRYYVNVGLYLGALVLVSTWGAAVGIVMVVARQPFDLNHFVAQVFYGLTRPLLSIDVEVDGRPYLDTRPAVFVGNHQSMLDVFVLGK
jgi:lysophosphatidate acyltransferase